MCGSLTDFVRGELLFAHHIDDNAAEGLALVENKSWPVRHLGSIYGTLADIGARMNPKLGLVVHRLGVPAGDEIAWIAELFRAYFARVAQAGAPVPEHIERLAIGPNHALRTSAINFKFGLHHSAYKTLLNESASAGTGSGVRIKVVDSGHSASAVLSASRIVKRLNVIDAATLKVVDDDTGHGTAVAEIIHALAPDADFAIYKVTETGKIVEWDMLAALCDDDPAQVVNLSVAFGLQTAVCTQCGHQSHSSRSAVFETVLKRILASDDKCVVVAATGNDGAASLSYPARFGDVLAVGSVDSASTISSFSNYGATDHIGATHGNLFFAPGGGGGEYVGDIVDSGVSSPIDGTSFAAAYASGLVAKMKSDPKWAHKRANQIMDDLRTQAHARGGHKMAAFAPADYGNGLLQL